MPDVREFSRPGAGSRETTSDRQRGTPAVSWISPHRRHRPQIAHILEEAGAFRPNEVDVALEGFDAYCDAPGVDYSAVAAIAPEDELAGFAFYGATPCTVGCWDLYWIAVSSRYRGSGLGRGLIERVERAIKAEAGRLCLIETSSRSDYEATRRFYSACGYDEVARVPDFYADGDDCVIYLKRFADPQSPLGRE